MASAMSRPHLLETRVGEDGTQLTTIMSDQRLWDPEEAETNFGGRMHLTTGTGNQILGPDQFQLSIEAHFLLGNVVSVTRLINTRAPNVLTGETPDVQFAERRGILERLVPNEERSKRRTKK